MLRTSDLTIEKNIPIPPKKELGGRTRMSKLWHMEIGDSVFCAGRSSSAMGGHLARIKKVNGWKFTSRNVDGGARIWRIK